jgi:hypothetical protein
VADAAAARLSSAASSLAGDREALAEDVRAHIVGIATAAILGVATGERAPRGIELAEVAAAPLAGLPTHLVAMRTVAARSVPALGAGPYRLYVSGDGLRLIVSWTERGALRYRETTADGWSDVIAPVVPNGVDPDALLRARVQ